MTMPFFIILFCNIFFFCNMFTNLLQKFQSRADLHSDEILDIGNAHMNQCSVVFVKFHKRVDRFLAFFGVGWHYSHENRPSILNDCLNTDPNVILHMVQEVLKGPVLSRHYPDIVPLAKFKVSNFSRTWLTF